MKTKKRSLILLMSMFFLVLTISCNASLIDEARNDYLDIIIESQLLQGDLTSDISEIANNMDPDKNVIISEYGSDYILIMDQNIDNGGFYNIEFQAFNNLNQQIPISSTPRIIIKNPLRRVLSDSKMTRVSESSFNYMYSTDGIAEVGEWQTIIRFEGVEHVLNWKSKYDDIIMLNTLTDNELKIINNKLTVNNKLGLTLGQYKIWVSKDEGATYQDSQIRKTLKEVTFKQGFNYKDIELDMYDVPGDYYLKSELQINNVTLSQTQQISLIRGNETESYKNKNNLNSNIFEDKTNMLIVILAIFLIYTSSSNKRYGKKR